MEHLSPEALEQLASDQSVPVPEHLDKDLRNLIDGLSGTEAILSSEEEEVQILSAEKTPHRRLMKIWAPLAGIAAGLLFIYGVQTFMDYHARPADTFSDPQTAYAEVERVMGLIADKMTPATEGLAQVDARIKEQVELFKK